jgi:hypothetical protein
MSASNDWCKSIILGFLVFLSALSS